MLTSGRWELQSHSRNGHSLIKLDADGKEGHFLTNKRLIEPENRNENTEEYLDRVENDLVGAKKDLFEPLGVEPKYFAYPFGDYGQNSLNFAEAKDFLPKITKKHYLLTFYQLWLGNGYFSNYPTANPFMVKRMEVKNDWTANYLLTILENSRDKSLPLVMIFSTGKGWLTSWGSYNIKDGSMEVKSSTETSGGLVFLDGTYSWENYKFKATVKLERGKTVSLLARHKDNNNYYACNFSPGLASISIFENGKGEEIWSTKDEFYPVGNEVKTAIEVDNNKIRCYWQGKLATYATLDKKNYLEQGGIGIKVWGEKLGESAATIKEIKILPVSE